ncbi:MAG: hypothetical protein DSM106950_03490 [Stigonema ocellatum SAG 48.90 = DSM 106950]|nr:hypothetical protein [Stigonema ocellatum SAG 48.90 = DSM 106950]
MTKTCMLSLILIAQINIPPHNLPSVLEVTPDTRQRFDNLQQRRQIQQHEEKVNAAQKRYEHKIQDLQTLPSSRIDCFPISTPVPGVDRDPISCSRP